MRCIPLVRLGCLILSFGSGVAIAQAQTLQVPAQRTVETPAKPPSAAPRQPVQQVGPSGRHPPVVEPHGAPHPQKPPAHPPKQAAKPAVPAPKPVTPSAAAVVTPPPAEAKPADTGKPGAPKSNVPRFAALRFDEVNMRVGPGPRYPIDWVYKRRDLPVQIEREFDIWRLIRDPDGTRGWVSEASLTGRRTFIVTDGDATLRQDASDTSSAVAILKPGVIGRIRSCQAGADWCQVQTADYRGYLKRTQFWGTQPGEAVTP
ncbi:MAG: SH3 domain-containing protein [Acetobacteraceae bacterium]|nr:SH3 domain-containing protein [Acetobacteraceae bacterium]